MVIGLKKFKLGAQIHACRKIWGNYGITFGKDSFGISRGERKLTVRKMYRWITPN